MVAQLLRLRADLLAGGVRGSARRSVLVVLGSLVGLVVANGALKSRKSRPR